MKKAPNSQNSEKPEKGHNEAVGAFFKDLGKCHPMSREEEQVLMAEMVECRDKRDFLAALIDQKNPEDISEDELNELQKAQHAYEKIRNIFVSRNLRLVAKMAKRYIRSAGMELTDLISEGSIGIMRAADKFDPGKGVRFTSYAGWWIRQTMNQANQEQSHTVKWPVNIQQLAYKIRRLQKEARTKDGQELTVEEIAAQVEESVGMVKRAMSFQQASIASLDAPMNNGDPNGGSFVERVVDENMDFPDDIIERQQDIQQIQELVKELEPREKQILEMRHGLEDDEPQTLQAIGDQFNLTRERIRQISNNTQEKLRRKILRVMGNTEMV